MTVHILDVWALSKMKLLMAPVIFRISFLLLFHLFLPYWISPNCLRESCKEEKACRLAYSNCTACTGSHTSSHIPGQKTFGQKTCPLSLSLNVWPFFTSSFSHFQLQVHGVPSSMLPPAHVAPHGTLSVNVHIHSSVDDTERNRRQCNSSGTDMRNRKVLTWNKIQWICKKGWFFTKLLLATATAFAHDLWQNFAVVKYPLTLIFCKHLELIWKRVPSITWKIWSYFSLIFKKN